MVRADQNDGDLLTQISKNVELGKLERLRDTVKILLESPKNNTSHNYGISWPTGVHCEMEEDPRVFYKDILTDNNIEFFEGFLPHGEHGIHTVENIEIHQSEEEVLLKTTTDSYSGSYFSWSHNTSTKFFTVWGEK